MPGEIQWLAAESFEELVEGVGIMGPKKVLIHVYLLGMDEVLFKETK